MSNKLPSDKNNKPERKHNLLFGMNGNAALQRRLSTGEFRGKRRKNWRRDGFAGDAHDKQINERHSKESINGLRVWYLPTNFCPDCNRNDIGSREFDGKSTLGLWMSMDGNAEVDMRPGDCMAYYMCKRCHDTMFEEQEKDYEEDNAPVLLDSHGRPIDNEQERMVDKLQVQRDARMEVNGFAWIKNAKLRGETYRVMNDS